MTQAKFKIGDLCVIEFLDHFDGDLEHVKCVACGWIEKNTKDYLILRYWKVYSSDATVNYSNSERFGVAKSAIIKMNKV